jgi:hypothetical protein
MGPGVLVLGLVLGSGVGDSPGALHTNHESLISLLVEIPNLA